MEFIHVWLRFSSLPITISSCVFFFKSSFDSQSDNWLMRVNVEEREEKDKNLTRDLMQVLQKQLKASDVLNKVNDMEMWPWIWAFGYVGGRGTVLTALCHDDSLDDLIVWTWEANSIRFFEHGTDGGWQTVVGGRHNSVLLIDKLLCRKHSCNSKLIAPNITHKHTNTQIHIHHNNNHSTPLLNVVTLMQREILPFVSTPWRKTYSNNINNITHLHLRQLCAKSPSRKLFILHIHPFLTHYHPYHRFRPLPNPSPLRHPLIQFHCCCHLLHHHRVLLHIKSTTSTMTTTTL